MIGCVGSKRIDKLANKASNLIDDELIRDAAASKNRTKLLLLVTDEPGKRALAQNTKISYEDGFSEKQRIDHKHVVYASITKIMLAILSAMESFDIPFTDKNLAEDSNKLYDAADDAEDLDLTGELGDLLKALWKDDGVQECFSRSQEYQLGDSAWYFLDALDRFCDSSYIPSELDVLHIRFKTTGIIETKFEHNNFLFTLIEMEEQRSKRMKWISCFQDVTAIIFCVDLAAYDQMLVEDEEINQMLESVKLFESICNNSIFRKKLIVLLLNNKGLFAEKIKKSPLTICFPEYEGKNEYEEASEYVRKQFEGQDKHAESREIYTHFTCATDTGNVSFVFDNVSNALIDRVFHDNV